MKGKWRIIVRKPPAWLEPRSLERVDGQQAPDRECPDCKGDGMRKWKRAVQPGANMSCLTCGGTGRVQIDASLRPIDKLRDDDEQAARRTEL